MTTVAAGATGTFTLTGPSNLDIAPASGGRALVVVTSSGSQLYAGRISSVKTIGPFPTGAFVSITADGPGIDYTVSGFSRRVHAANSDGDFSPTYDTESLQVLANSGVALPLSAINWTPETTALLRRAKFAARSNDQRVLVLAQGDSFLGGAGANGATANLDTVNCRPKSALYKAMKILNANGITASANWYGGNGLVGATRAMVGLHDPRLKFTGGFVSAFGGIGGFLIGENTAAGTYVGGISGTTLTVSSVTTLVVKINEVISGTGITAGTTIEEQLTGTPNGVGTYRVSVSQTVAPGTAITGSIDSFTFTPDDGSTFDTIRFLVPRGSALGTAEVVVDSDATVRTINQFSGTGNDMILQTMSVTPGATKFTYRRGTGTNYFLPFGVSDSSKPGIELCNASVAGAELAALNQVPDAANNAYVNSAAEPLLWSDVSIKIAIYGGWYNDRTAGKTITQVVAIHRTKILSLQAQGATVVFFNYAPLDTSVISKATFDAYSDAVIANAISLGCPVIDCRKIIPDWATANSWGWWANSLHLKGAGQAVIAEDFAQAWMAA